MVQCSTRDLRIASLVLAHCSFLVRGVALLLTLAELYGLQMPSSGGFFNPFFFLAPEERRVSETG